MGHRMTLHLVKTRTSCLLRATLYLVLAFIVLVQTAESHGQTQARQVPVDSLIYDLKNPDPVRRKEAARMLGNNRVQRATPDLVAAASDSDPEVRREIVIALDKMRDIRALPGLVSLSGDPEKDIRDRSIQGLVSLYLPQESGLVVTLNKVASFFNPWSDDWADVVVEPGIDVDPGAVTALRNRLQDSDEGIRTKACRALGILRGRDAVPALMETVRGERSNTVRYEAIRSLRKIGDASAAKELMNYIGYNDAKIRNEAVYTIGRLRHAAALPELTRLFEKENALPRKQIDKIYRATLLEAIAFLADSSSKELLFKEKQNPDDLLRLYAVSGLARIGDASMVTDVSRDRLHEKDPKIRTAQAYALHRMGRKEFLDELVNALGSRKTNQEARQYLLEFGSGDLPDLYGQLKSQDVNVREGLAEVIGFIGDSTAIVHLQELGQDRRGEIQALANQAMRRINARSAHP